MYFSKIAENAFPMWKKMSRASDASPPYVETTPKLLGDGLC